MARDRRLKRVLVEVECSRDMYGEGAQQVASKINEFFKALSWTLRAVVRDEWENVCTVCNEAFEFDRFGCCPRCGTWLGDPDE